MASSAEGCLWHLLAVLGRELNPCCWLRLVKSSLGDAGLSFCGSLPLLVGVWMPFVESRECGVFSFFVGRLKDVRLVVL